FYPERRPFFTEGTQIFNFPLVPEGFAFYSRRIGRSPQVTAKVPTGGFSDAPGTATILGAAKVSGKTGGGTSLGLITAVTGAAGEGFIARIGGSRMTWQAGGGFRTPGFEVNVVGYVSYTDVWYWSLLSRYRVAKPRGRVRDWWVEGQQVTARTFGGQILRPS